MRVWLKGFNFTFKCPAVINVWKVLWVYLKFCDTKNSVLSVFHPLRSVLTLFFFSSLTPRLIIVLLLLHMWIIARILLWSCTAFCLIYIFLSMQAWFFISAQFYQCEWVLILEGIESNGCKGFHLWVERAPCWTCIYFLIASNVNGKQSFFGL